jgi:predicted metalloendopeptidase
LFVTAATDPKCVSDNELQLGRMYAACMDMTQRNAQGAAPIVPILHRIENEVRDADSAMSVAGDLARDYLISFFFNFGVSYMLCCARGTVCDANMAQLTC